MVYLYNTLTKQKEKFEPINPPKVTFYMCGPTIYDYFHIGNARSFIMSDIIRRYLLYRGFDVKFAMNMTDIDDKIIKRANEEKKNTKEIAETYGKAFLEDLGKLKVNEADIFPKATENMDAILDMIKRLVDKGFAYAADGDVFFDISKFEGYGKLSGKKIDELEAGSRVEVNKAKRNPLDFSLWKKAKESEPFWESPWGKGRPGWHIECSAMSTKHLGMSFDIHGGGSDLIFPHHENEIAQSEAANGKQFAKYWIHFGFLNIDNEKMSKSLGNFFTARDVVKMYPAHIIRLFFAQTHYAAQLNYSQEGLEASKKGLEKIQNLAETVQQGIKAATKDGIDLPIDIGKFEHSFMDAMDDDFNSPKAIAVIFDFVKECNRLIASAEGKSISVSFFEKVKVFLQETAEAVLGIIDFDAKSENDDVTLADDLIKLFIELRIDAKKDKDFALADKIRDGLKNIGVVLADSKEGTTYKIVK